jgi:hypothetical protein
VNRLAFGIRPWSPIQHPISSRGGIHSPLIVRLNNSRSEGGKIKRSLFRSSFYAGTTAQLDAQFFKLVNSIDNLRWQLAVTMPLSQTQVDLFQTCVDQ